MDDTIVAVVNSLIDSSSAELEYDRECWIEWRPDGTAVIEEDGEEYVFPLGAEPRSGREDFANEVWSVAGKARAALVNIPPGNLAEMGGRDGLIRALFIAERAAGYAAR